MTPTRSELLDRAYELRDQVDEIYETRDFTTIERKMHTFLCDIIEELESC